MDDLDTIIKSMAVEDLIEKSYEDFHPKHLIVLDGKFYGVDWTRPALGQKCEDVKEAIIQRYLKIHKAQIAELSAKPPEYFISVVEEKEEIAICFNTSTSIISTREQGRGKKRKVIETSLPIKTGKGKPIACEVRRKRTKYIPTYLWQVLRIYLPEKLKEVEKQLTTETEIYMEY
jgi:hypothetical protein